MTPIKRLTEVEVAEARRAANNCVVCHKRYDDLEIREALHVYPDGCTAHDACYMSEDGAGTAHWHNKTESCERCGQREPTTDVSGWVCDECAAELRRSA